MSVRRAKRARVTRGSDNVFADLGVANATAELLKADVVVRLARTIQSKRLSQSRAAAVLGITQPQVSNLLRGKTYGFSTDRLLGFLINLGHDVNVRIGKARNGTGRMHVVSA
jgi:predicted XRE-type DNA-binding protein